MQSNNFPIGSKKNLRLCGKIGGNTATLLEKAFKWALSSTQAHFWWLSCSFCFTLRDRIMIRWHYSQGKSRMPAEIDTEERILYFLLEMLVLHKSRNLNSPFLSFLILPFCFHWPPFLGDCCKQPVVSRGHRSMESQRCEVCSIWRPWEGMWNGCVQHPWQLYWPLAWDLVKCATGYWEPPQWNPGGDQIIINTCIADLWS